MSIRGALIMPAVLSCLFRLILTIVILMGILVKRSYVVVAKILNRAGDGRLALTVVIICRSRCLRLLFVTGVLPT